MTGFDFFIIPAGILAALSDVRLWVGVVLSALCGSGVILAVMFMRRRLVLRAPSGGPGPFEARPPAVSLQDVGEPVWSDSGEILNFIQNIGGFGYWSGDIDTGEMVWSDPLYRIYGLEPGTVRPSLERMLAAVGSPDRQRFAAVLRETVKHGTPFALDMRLTQAEGDSAEIRIMGRPVFTKDESVHRVIGIVQDITEFKRVETDEPAGAKAENAADMQNEVLAQMSHELRTPMNAILGYAQILKMEAGAHLEERHQAYLDDAIAAGRHLSNLIEGILEFSKLEAGEMALKTARVDPAALLREAGSSLALEAEEAGITLDIQADDDLPSVMADRTRLLQALLNLGSNAIKYNRVGGSVCICAEAVGNGTVRFSISDTGTGIPVDREAELFQPFRRLGMEKTDIPGTGIGLAITKRLVEAMSGRLTVESRAGAGTTFSLVLPVAGADAPALSAQAESGQTPAFARSGSGARSLLYIGDDSRTLRLMNRAQSDTGLQRPLSARTGADGLALARQHQPDLVIVDLNTLDLNGQEILARLKRDARTAHLPVVAMLPPGGSARPAGGAVGFDAYLTKPLDADTFADLVRAFGSERADARCAS